MARYTRIQVATKMAETGMVPVFFHKDVETCKQVVAACYKAGVKVFEFTNRGDFAHEIYGALHKYGHSKYPDLIMGAGTIIDAPTAALYMQMGANFIVSPILDEETAKICNRRKVLWIPGTGSVTEISRAEELGADIVKIFPGGAVGGPGFVKAVKGPMPWSSLMPTNGVEPNEDSIREWFSAGIASVGLGSQIFTKELTTLGREADLIVKIQQVLKWINQYKK